MPCSNARRQHLKFFLDCLNPAMCAYLHMLLDVLFNALINV